jgi:hypothetical protein
MKFKKKWGTANLLYRYIYLALIKASFSVSPMDYKPLASSSVPHK